MGALATLPGSSAATRRRVEAAPASLEVAHASGALRESAPVRALPSALVPNAFFFFQAAPETVATYAADCATPKNSFNLGETVCVKISGAPTSGAVVVLSDPEELIRGNTLGVTSSSQSFNFSLPSSPNSGGVDNRGTWTAAVVNTEDNSRRVIARFFVHDPQEQVADVTISKTALDTQQALAGSNTSYRIYVTNQGPDPATNVSFVDNTLPNTTFVSFTDDGASGFNCTPPAVGSVGQTTCTKATMAVGETASFTAVYLVSTNAGTGADLTDTIEVESDTTDSHESSNSSTVEGSAVNPNPPACTISCPANISQDSDPGQPGAVVNYNAPTTSGTCGSVSTDHPSGTFFSIGTTVVTSDAGNGVTCAFSVTVIDKRTVTVTVNGAADITIECRNGFTDAGATASDGTNSLPVTTTVTIPDPSGATDSNGDAVQVPAPGNVVNPNAPNTYTITYTATDSNNNTGKATRIVRVVDTAPPVITLSGVAGFTPQTETVTVTNDDGTTSTVSETILVGTVECHDGFPPPTGTAFDGCDNHSVPVTTSGSVDTGTPGVYTIIYRASDASGNDTEQRIRVTVVDTTGPVISLNGASPMTVECHTSFTDPGASASDACEGPVTVSASGSVNPNVVGTYTITYTASDSGGRTTTRTRIVNVVDTTPPTISCSANILVNYDPAVGGAVVTYAAPTGADSCAGVLTATQTTGLPSGSTFPAGSTTNTFKVTDGAGLTASCSFKVNVALTSVIGLDSVSITGAGPVDSYDSNGGYPATKGSLASVLSNGTITMTGSAKVAGSVRSTRAGVVMSGASQVTGNATAGTTVSRSGSASVGGTITNNALVPSIAVPSVPSCGPPYSANSDISGTYSYNAGTGDLSLTGVNVATLANGTYCFHNLSVGNSAQLKVNGPVTIKLTGTLSVSGAANINNTTLIPGNLRILSSYGGSGGVSFGNSSSAYLVVYAPGTGVTLSGASPLFGTVVGKTLTISNSGMLHYDTRLQTIWPDLWASVMGP